MPSRPVYSSIPQERIAANSSSLLGLEVLNDLHSDAFNLLITKGLRMFSFGFLSVILVLYLSSLGFLPQQIGLLFSLTLLGDAMISLLLTSYADKFGRKKTLILGGLLSALTSVIFSTGSDFWLLLVAGIFGVISPSGNEIGPFMAIELACLAQVTRDQDRTRLMAWYNLVGCFSSAFGAFFCGWMISVFSGPLFGYSLITSYRLMMGAYSILQLLLVGQFLALSKECEVPTETAKVKNTNPVSLFLGLHKSKGIVLKLCCLFMIDSFAGSFALQSLMSGWFDMTYHTAATKLGAMVFVCNIVAGISALFAAKLADIIGLILTMGLTHLPSNILLILIPLMPNESLAIVMLCARFCISQMDVPTRNAYVQGVVEVDERSAAAGVTNVVRSIGAGVGPYLAGMLFANPVTMNCPFFIAGGLKIVYDLLLMASFASVKPPEEMSKAATSASEKVIEVTPLSKA